MHTRIKGGYKSLKFGLNLHYVPTVCVSSEGSDECAFAQTRLCLRCSYMRLYYNLMYRHINSLFPRPMKSAAAVIGNTIDVHTQQDESPIFTFVRFNCNSSNSYFDINWILYSNRNKIVLENPLTEFQSTMPIK